METKHERPYWIKEFKKPVGTEIKYINGHWYLYERSSIWDSTKGKPKKKSGKLIGTITPQGLILKQEKINLEELSCFEFGASIFLYSISKELREDLFENFNEEGKLIYALILFKTKDNINLSYVKPFYDTSYFKSLIGKISFNPENIAKGLKHFYESKFYQKYNNPTFEEFLDLNLSKINESIINSDSKFAKTEKEALYVINYFSFLLKLKAKQYLKDKKIPLTLESLINLLKTYFIVKQNRKFIITKPTKAIEKIFIQLDLPFDLKKEEKKIY